MSDHAALRSGLLTASIAKRVVSGTAKGKNTLLRKLWDAELHAEEFRKPTPPGSPMDHGNRMEKLAIADFWDRHPEYFVDDENTFRRFHDPSSPVYPWVGASPDAILGRGQHMSVLEIKSPVSERSYDSYRSQILDATVPKEHHHQLQWQMWVLGADSGWFMCYWNVDGEVKSHEIYALPDARLFDEFTSSVLEFAHHLQTGELF